MSCPRSNRAVPRVLVGIVAVAAASAGCSWSGGNAESEAAPVSSDSSATVLPADPRQLTKASRAWTREIPVVGQPELAGSTALVLAQAPGDRLKLMGLDVETGRTLFESSYHPGGLPSGVQLAPRFTQLADGRYVALLRSAEPGPRGSFVTALDVRTGNVVAEAALVSDDYDACADGHDVCVSGWQGSPDFYGIAEGRGPQRWDLKTDRMVESRGYQDAMAIGRDLFWSGEGSTAHLSRIRGYRRPSWSVPVGQVFREGSSTSAGWSFEYDEPEDVYVGGVGRPASSGLLARYRRGHRVRFPLVSRYEAVGVDGETGERLWRKRGANPWCEFARGASEARTLCMIEGTSVQKMGEDAQVKGISMSISGVNPRSGAATWSVPLSEAGARRAYMDEVVPLTPYGGVVESARGQLISVDTRDGRLMAVSPDAVLLCERTSDVKAYGVTRSNPVYRLCTPSGKPADGPLSLWGAMAIEGSGHLRVVSQQGRVVAYDVPD
ncbi:PQQ-binding-like beta-propeller repeat protein [Nocardioides seonyuensis]|nr:PQQ-binding-like beta-propeller repeat protein [Nocardioides seonyuensis]